MKSKIVKETIDETELEFKEQDKILKKWVERNYGKKCPEYCKGCILCEKWKLFGNLKLSDGKR